MMMKIICTVAAIFLLISAQSQDISYNRKIVDTLTSPAFWGRGYTADGMKKAAKYLAAEFKNIGAAPLTGKKYLQEFQYPVNSFPGDIELTVNGKRLTPGEDFIPDPGSPSIKGKGEFEQADSITVINKENAFVLQLADKLTWSVSQKVEDYAVVTVNRKSLDDTPKSFSVNIKNKLIEEFKAFNVCAMIPGTAKPDSFLFITAHYDHLGGLGSKTYFPGANDNASGVALLLSLAKYYVAHPQRYSIGFLLFAGEEAGLVGSKYFTEHPLVPLKKIRFLLNTDLAGTGDDGITVVNATEFPKEFELMKNINNQNNYLKDIGARGKAANSDHYWFTEKGVPAFFFYTRGGVSAYHDVFDRGATLPLNEQADLQELIIKFFAKLN